MPGAGHVDPKVDDELDDLKDHGEGDAQIQRDGAAEGGHQGAVFKLERSGLVALL